MRQASPDWSDLRSRDRATSRDRRFIHRPVTQLLDKSQQ
jgi:hypothetical protein